MSDFHRAAEGGLSPAELEVVLRTVGAERYHNHHPYHRRMTGGDLSRGELQAWALNRYCYQAVIPRKDAMILSHAEDPAFRAIWRRRIEDHDGEDGWSGGIARWLHLATSVGLDADAVKSERLALPATRFAVGAYLSFCTDRTLLEGVASSLTELFSPTIIKERVSAVLARYDYVAEDALAYFTQRPEQATRDADFALVYVLEHADTAERQQAAIDALVFKCDILWAMLDTLQHAYGEGGTVPPGAFRPGPAMIPLRERAMVSPSSVPSLPKHVRIRYDPVRLAYAVLSPEKVFWPNDISLDILRRCDGRTAVGRIVAGLAADYDAEEKDVAADVIAFLQEWSDKLLVRL